MATLLGYSWPTESGIYLIKDLPALDGFPPTSTHKRKWDILHCYRHNYVICYRVTDLVAMKSLVQSVLINETPKCDEWTDPGAIISKSNQQPASLNPEQQKTTESTRLGCVIESERIDRTHFLMAGTIIEIERELNDGYLVGRVVGLPERATELISVKIGESVVVRDKNMRKLVKETAVSVSYRTV